MLNDPVDQKGFIEKPSFASLLQGLIRDTTLLIRQEFTLGKDEVYAEVRNLKTAGLSVGIGTGLMVAERDHAYFRLPSAR
jgi:hypothetical protein